MSVRLCVVAGSVLVVVLGVCLSGLSEEKAAAVEKAAKAKQQASGAELVRAALLAEVSGKAQERSQLLKQAIAKEPDFAPARWHAGYVRVGDRWLSLDQAERGAAQDKRLAEYRKLRDELVSDPQADGKLARWCRDHELKAEARAHWVRVLAAQPQNVEAVKALGLAWHQGQLLTQEQIDQQRKPRVKSQDSGTSRVKAENQWTAHWEAQLAKWRRSLDGTEAKPAASLRGELDAVNDPQAVRALGTLLFTRSQWRQDRKIYQDLSLTLVQSLQYREEPWALSELVRQAVDHPLAEVRSAAADALKKRPLEQFVPLLVRRLRLPIEASGSVASLGLGGAVYQYSLEQEGPDGVYVQNRVTHAHVKGDRLATDRDPGSVTVRPIVTEKEIESAKAQADANVMAALAAGRVNAAKQSVRAHQQAAAVLSGVQRNVEATNAEIAENNARVQFVLGRATGADVADSPLAWMKWWNRYYCDYYELSYPTDESESEPKPVYEATWWDYKPMQFATPYPMGVSVGRQPRVELPPGRHSCLPWNTKVWTLSGAVNIDQIKPGDRVLAQHPRTGELAYKPVLEVTKRKPSPMMKIGVGKDMILTTRGHPFWVCGEGWKMAKQLQVSSRLHTVAGPTVIDRVEQAPAAGPWYEQLKDRPDAKPEDVLSYNLVVDDFHNYFVGEGKVLVHDNVLFPLDGPVPPVPGLALKK